MFDRMSERAIKAIMLAEGEARRMRTPFVGTEHLLLGLLLLDDGLARQVLHEHGVDVQSARSAIDKMVAGTDEPMPEEMPFTERAKMSLEKSWRAAKQPFAKPHIDDEHLLAGVLSAGEGVAWKALEALGKSPGSVWDAVTRLINDNRDTESGQQT